MTKRDIKSIILYLDSAEAIEYLTNEQTGILFKAVFRYARTGQKLESSDTALTALFTILCAQIDRDHKKYEERCERNVANAKKRYEKPIVFCQVARSINCRCEPKLWFEGRCLGEPVAVYGCGYFKQISLAKGWRTDALFLQLQGWILRTLL